MMAMTAADQRATCVDRNAGTLVGLLVAAGTAVPVLAALTPDGVAWVLFAVIAAVAAGLAAYLGLPAQAPVPAEHAGHLAILKKLLHVHGIPVQHHHGVNVGDLPTDSGNPGEGVQPRPPAEIGRAHV